MVWLAIHQPAPGPTILVYSTLYSRREEKETERNKDKGGDLNKGEEGRELDEKDC